MEGRKLRIRFTNLKEKHDDVDFTLELLAKKFQGEEVFIGGGEVVLDLGEVMTVRRQLSRFFNHFLLALDTIEHLRKIGEYEEEEPVKSKI